MSHGDTVFSLPPEFEVLAHTKNCPVAAFRHKKKPIYGLQWHPEVIHTENGALMLRNFIFEVCKCEANWQMEDLIEKMVKELKTEVGDGKAIIGLSGGIDSSVATAIAAQALNDRLTAVFVDHGFMREGEPEEVRNAFQKIQPQPRNRKCTRKVYGKTQGSSRPREETKNHRRRIRSSLSKKIAEQTRR